MNFNNTTNVTTADINYPKDEGLMTLMFQNMQRSPSAAQGSGVLNIAPYCDQKNMTLFTPMFIKVLEPFDHLRFMGALGTNYKPGYYGDKVNHIITWNHRSLPSDSIQSAWTDLRPGWAWG